MDRTELGICRAARIVLRRAHMVRRMMRSPFSFAINFCKEQIDEHGTLQPRR